MSEGSTELTGGCRCGLVRFVAEGEAFSVMHCHCSSCRRQTGAAVATLAGFRSGQVSFSGGERKLFASSPGVGRSFCPDCGTPIAWEGHGGDLGPIVDIHISCFDDPSALTPQGHMHHGERIVWFDTADSLPRYRAWHFDDEPYLDGPAV